MLHTLMGQAVKHDCKFFIEYFATDLLMHDGMLIAVEPPVRKAYLDITAGACHGVMAYNMEDGTFHRFRAHQTVLATGVRVSTLLDCTPF